MSNEIEKYLENKRLNSIKNRYKNNMIILDELKKYLEENKDIRFIQALWNLNLINSISNNDDKNIDDIEDRFYEESDITLEKLVY